MILKNRTNNCLLNPLIMQCRNMMRMISHNFINHTYQNVNWCANSLPKKGQVQQLPFTMLSSPYTNITSIFKEDVSPIMFPYFVPISIGSIMNYLLQCLCFLKEKKKDRKES